MATVQSFEELEVWQAARQLVKKILAASTAAALLVGCKPSAPEEVYWRYEVEDVSVARALSVEKRGEDREQFKDRVAFLGSLGWELVAVLPRMATHPSINDEWRLIFKQRSTTKPTIYERKYDAAKSKAISDAEWAEQKKRIEEDARARR